VYFGEREPHVARKRRVHGRSCCGGCRLTGIAIRFRFVLVSFGCTVLVLLLIIYELLFILIAMNINYDICPSSAVIIAYRALPFG
jgi:hypothetical protein